jgi:CRP-like cAMP-binding protein
MPNEDQKVDLLRLAGLPFFHGMPRWALARIAQSAGELSLPAGHVLIRQHDHATAVFVLLSGAVQIHIRVGTDDLLVGVLRGEGELVGWSTFRPRYRYTASVSCEEPTLVVRVPARVFEELVEPYTYRASATARERTTMLVLPRDDLDRYARKNPRFGVALMRGVIGLIGDRVQATRLRLIARRYDDEVAAVRQLVHDSGDRLPLSSPLHKIPHYLANRPTIDDAFHTLEVVRRRGDPTESRVAELCVDVLGNVRRELDLYQRLQAIYSAVADAPPDMDPEAVRRRSLAGFRELFAGTRYRIAGRHLLPERSGQIFIMNHLMNHPENLLPNDFILTLDTHFAASMILLERYGEAPIRVVRKSRPDEYGHQRFYDRLGYGYTYSGYVDPDPADPANTLENRRRFFFESAAGDLGRGRNI